MNRFWHWLSIITFTLVTALLITFTFWSVYDYPTPDVKQPIQILNKDKQIAVGEPITMRVYVSKPAEYSPQGSVFLTCNDGNLVTLASLVTNLPTGDYAVINDKYILPPKVAVGSKCVFNFKNTYQVNPIRSVTKHWVSETFIIKE